MLYSELDPAGVNIASQLRKIITFSAPSCNESHAPCTSHGDLFLAGIKGHLVEMGAEVAASFPGAEWLLCLSRHASASGKGCLTAHTPGNLTLGADLGGNPGEVAISNPLLQSLLIKELKSCGEALGIDYQVTLEATHHGPTILPFPVTFVEIGSDVAAWENETLGKVVARAVQRAVTGPSEAGRNALGVGGGHYPEKFTRLVEEGGCLMGHIVPKYAMAGGMDEKMFGTCIERTAGGCSCIFADWKGTPSNFKDALRMLSESSGIELVRV